MTSARYLLLSQAATTRKVNLRRVIRAVMASPAARQGEIAALTGLSQAAVSSLVQQLQREEVVRVDTSSGGRGNRVRLNDIRGAAVGLEVGLDSATIVTRRVDAPDYACDSVKIAARQPRAEWLAECARLINEHVRHYDLDPADILSIGLGIPAGVDPHGATTPVTLYDNDLIGRPAEWFHPYFPDVPVIADKDANFAAYGELRHGAGRHIETMLYVKASRTITAGLIMDGAIVRGRHGLASELGHLRMHPDGVVCRCGNRGCLETLVSGPRLLAQVRDAYIGEGADSDLRQREPTDLEELIDRASTGDPVCLRVLRDAARTIGAAIAQACNLVNPDLVVLGGELGHAADLLIGPAREGLAECALPGMVTGSASCRIVGSELKTLAGARGALAFGLVTEPPIRPGFAA